MQNDYTTKMLEQAAKKGQSALNTEANLAKACCAGDKVEIAKIEATRQRLIKQITL